MVLATTHLFNDGNELTEFRCMDVVLLLHNIVPEWEAETVGQKIIGIARGQIDEAELETCLRGLN